jgi:hypothetical protein
MSCNGYKKKCWLNKQSNCHAMCNTCNLTKQKERFNKVLSQQTKAIKMYTQLQEHDSIISFDTNFDRLIRCLLEDKPFLREYLKKHIQKFIYRMYTHSESDLCDVFCWALHSTDLDLPIPNSCLKCLSHTLRYSSDKYTKSLILRSLVVYYDDCPNTENLVKKSNEKTLYEFGSAIIEQQGIDGVFGPFLNLIKGKDELISKLQLHPLLHSISDTNILKKELYTLFKKKPFEEELMARAYEPSRVIWCMTEEDKRNWDL